MKQRIYFHTDFQTKRLDQSRRMLERFLAKVGINRKFKDRMFVLLVRAPVVILCKHAITRSILLDSSISGIY